MQSIAASHKIVEWWGMRPQLSARCNPSVPAYLATVFHGCSGEEAWPLVALYHFSEEARPLFIVN